MRLAAAALVVLALVSAAGAAATGPPRAGILVPGRSLGGLTLGQTKAQVQAAWGSRYGTCRSCRQETWYFNLRPYRPEGAGVTFRGGRVSAIFTLWAPAGWQTRQGLRIGDLADRLTSFFGTLPRAECGKYAVHTLRGRDAVTRFYALEFEIWGFALARPGTPVCRPDSAR